MPDLRDLGYAELTKAMVDGRVVDDINRLLPQMSSSAALVTEEWLHYVLDSGTCVFIATDQERIIGIVLLSPMVILVGQKDWIEDVVVDEEYRRMGIAGRLMDMAEAASKERGAKSINLTSKPERDDARRMYVDRGYVIRNTGVFRKTF